MLVTASRLARRATETQCERRRAEASGGEWRRAEASGGERRRAEASRGEQRREVTPATRDPRELRLCESGVPCAARETLACQTALDANHTLQRPQRC